MTNPLLALTDAQDATLALLLAQEVPTVAWTKGLGWLTYEGHVWEAHGSETVPVQAKVMEWLHPLILDAVTQVAPTSAVAAQRYVGLLSQRRLEGVLGALKRGVVVPLDAWDSQPHHLNTPTGVLDLRTGDLLPHDPGLRLTRSTSVGYREGASHPDWEKALQSQPSVDDRAWLQATLGSGCWGRQRGDSLALLTGHGANGKSTITGGVVQALGSYASLVDRSVIVGKGHPEHKAGLRGLRLALVEELEDGHRLNMAEVKALLGTESVVGRHLYQAAIQFPAQFTMVVTTNYKPQVPDTDHGTWRRLDRLDFAERYEGTIKDGSLRRRVREGVAQREAVLAWLVQGALSAIPDPTPAMLEAKDEWRLEADSIAAFIRDHVHLDREAFTPRTDLYQAFSEWLVAQGQKPWAARTFHSRWVVHPYVEAMQATVGKRNGARGWLGLRLEATEATEEGSHSDHPF